MAKLNNSINLSLILSLLISLSIATLFIKSNLYDFFNKYLILLLSHGMLRYIHNTTSVFIFIFMYLGKNIGH